MTEQGTTRHMPLQLACVSLIPLLLLPGCAGGQDVVDDTQVSASIVGEECLGAAKGHCAIEGGILILRGLSLTAAADRQGEQYREGRPQVGLRVEASSIPVIVQSSDISGFWIGVIIAEACSDCRVEIQNSSIEAVYTAIQLGSTKAGPLTADVNVRQSSIVAFDTPPEMRVTPNDFMGLGIVDVNFIDDQKQTAAFRGTLHLEDVHMQALGVALGPAVSVPQAELLEAHHVKTQGYEYAIQASRGETRLRDIDIRCSAPYYIQQVFSIAPAITVFGGADFDAEGLTIQGCGNRELDSLSVDKAGRFALTAGALNPSGGRFSLRNATFSDNAAAFLLQQFASVSLQDIMVERAEYGVEINPAQDVTIENLTIRDVEETGALIFADSLAIENSVFQRNAVQGLTPALWIGMTGNSLATVRNSSFEDNGRALSPTTQAALPIDARENWWGSPLGPSPGPRTPPLGDSAVGALTIPYLMSPP